MLPIKQNVLVTFTNHAKQDHALKTVIANKEIVCDFETYRNFVEL